MRNTKIKIALTTTALLLMLGFKSSFAADFAFKEAPKVVEQSSSGITLTWEKLNGATGYLVMYGTKSGSGGGTYESELPDLTESTGASIPKLESGKTYYIAVSAFDSEFNEVTSPELVAVFSGVTATPVSTGSTTKATTTVTDTKTTQSATAKFTMKNVEIISDKELKVSFSNELNSDAKASKEFMLTPKDNKNSEIGVKEVKVQGSNAVLTLKDSLSASTEYELVAISVADKNGNTIESGVDGMVAFSTPVNFGSAADVELNAASEMPAPNDTMSATATPEIAASTGSVENTGSLNAAAAGQDAKALPKTGPAEMMFVILALMLGGVVAFVTRKRA